MNKLKDMTPLLNDLMGSDAMESYGNWIRSGIYRGSLVRLREVLGKDKSF